MSEIQPGNWCPAGLAKETKHVLRREQKVTVTNGEIKRRNSTMREKGQCLVTETDASITGLSPAVAFEYNDEHSTIGGRALAWA